MKNKEVARLLDSIGDLLEIKGENTFRVGAYRSAARHIEGLSEDIEQVAHGGGLRSLPGVGESLAARIMEYLETGHLQYFEELKAAIPPGLIELLQVPGLGPKKTRLVYEKLDVRGIEDLERAVREHRLRDLPGLGEKTEKNIEKELERWRNRSARRLLGDALPLAEEIVDALKTCAAVERVEPAGSIRRRRETIGDVDILASSERADEVIAWFDALPIVKEVIARGPTKSSVLTQQDIQVDLRVVKPESFGAALQYFTGSKEHNVKLRELAQKRGLKVNEYGIYDEATGRRLGGESEDDIYRIVGLVPVPPEIREDRGEIEAAQKGLVPELIEVSDIVGDLHMHTNWSDGQNTLEEMARAAMARGYHYVAICDHSRSLAVAHGLSPQRVLEQRRLIDQSNARLSPFQV
ncbi:MAG: helix-hairpin-helix domain-containing protein, partial [Chloroflexi bacterium]|nr:helix-hairpin-helix domain-containing protein [Chloroflexota bacterium]